MCLCVSCVHMHTHIYNSHIPVLLAQPSQGALFYLTLTIQANSINISREQLQRAYNNHNV
jgi:hypothetical protein